MGAAGQAMEVVVTMLDEEVRVLLLLLQQPVLMELQLLPTIREATTILHWVLMVLVDLAVLAAVVAAAAVLMMIW